MIDKVTQNIQSFYQIRYYNLHKFQPKMFIRNDLGPFELKTVTTTEELKEALSLRYSVFHHEPQSSLQLNTKNTRGMDIDEFDFDCDHLIIKDKRNDKIIATCRLRCSSLSSSFYLATEFHMNHVLQQPGVKLEVGRTCVHRDYRQGVVISMIWKGLADYLALTEAEMLLGMVTVFSDDPRDAALLMKFFEEQGRMTSGFRTVPTAAFTMPLLNYFSEELRSPLTETQKETAKDLLPSIGKSILNTGAYIGGEPAWDPNIQCLDFLFILHREDLNRSLWNRPLRRA